MGQPLVSINDYLHAVGQLRATQLGTALKTSTLNAGICASLRDEGCDRQGEQSTHSMGHEIQDVPCEISRSQILPLI